jgi:hypothetical protein
MGWIVATLRENPGAGRIGSILLTPWVPVIAVLTG